MKKFEITDGQELEIKEWQDRQKKPRKEPAIGGRWSYSFTPTGIGVAVVVIDNSTGNELHLLDNLN